MSYPLPTCKVCNEEMHYGSYNTGPWNILGWYCGCGFKKDHSQYQEHPLPKSGPFRELTPEEEFVQSEQRAEERMNYEPMFA